jgi:hypothetical protein
MEKTLIKGKLRKVLNRALKMSNYELGYSSRCTIPISVTNVRMYVDNDRWACYKYRFEVDVEATVPTHDGGPSTFKYSDDRYISKLIRGRLTYQVRGIEKKCRMFTGNDGNTEVIYKKVSIIRNNTPPSLENSQVDYVVLLLS